ncbi:SusD family protein [Pedobacter sp. ok626]|uniref:RagB/SusD family nutrient uptake outer membrane protein n=1 Tax=Pedobacter sp. ok626 TaxID=1761882 RepID=UPI000891C5BD|nr:RagB/SusD family nutrient uptake outer membrane protein [Pedobacter sp. ok626]SDJ54352.1 SusD family protein [Pedobacter sp. ok626]
MKILYKLSICLLLSSFSLSCNKWIDVKPTDRLSENVLFANKEGYLKALNGVYIEMTNQALYGQEMTSGALDVLAQYYFMNSSTHRYYEYTTFVYTADRPKATFDNAWRKAYELIANCNVILEKCGDSPSEALPEPYFGIIKGETLALRAFLHFDMLRLFGPIYTEASKTKAVLPYISKNTFSVAPFISSEQFMQNVTDDLKAAILLMQTTDPIRTAGVRNAGNPSGNNDLYYRQYRLNYYAVRALLARAYLWQTKKAEAFTEAVELLNEVQLPTKIVFPYVTNANATSTLKPDRVFSTEVMFSLYDINRDELYKRLFDVNLLANAKLSFNGGDSNEGRVTNLYDDANDYRRRSWQILSSGTITALTNLKYQDIPDGPGRYMIPLIRLSEVLLIAAECSPDLSVGIGYFNKVRTARNALSKTPVNDATLKTEISNEYRREMLGEGQQFFYYKRNSTLTVPNNAAVTGTKAMVLNNYVVPLPESETSQRNN